MRKLLILALAGLLALLPLQLGSAEPTIEQRVKQAGCQSEVVTSDEHSVFQSFYDPYNEKIYVGTRPGEPDFAKITVLMHEVAHCLQFQRGVNPADYNFEYYRFELEADMMGADLQCRLFRKDGAKNNHDTLAYVHLIFGYDGDPDHGTLAQRIEAGYKAPACQKPAPPRVEAP